MAALDKTSILIVDDLPEKLLAYETLLEELGQNVISVRSGEEALKQVLKHDFAVILLDVNMPGMHGFETAHLIRARKRSARTPIIFLTAFTDELQLTRGYAYGAVDYILTPVVPEILRAKVRVFVELFQMRQQVARQAEEQAKRAAAEESARRSAFLAEASRTLANSLDFEATLQALLHLGLPDLGDLSLVVLAEQGQPGRTACAWVVPGAGVASAPGRPSPAAWLAGPLARVLASGNPLPATPAQPLPAVEGAGAGSGFLVGEAVLLPLVARGRTLGVLVLASRAGGRQLRVDQASLAVEVSGRAAIALDNALLVRDIQEADHRKNEFLAMLSHELRNPLAPVRNALQILELCNIDHPRFHWARAVIGRQVDHLIRLVDDLLDVSRITQGKIRLQLGAVDVAEVVATAVETSRPLIDGRNQTLTVNLPDEPGLLRADPARIAQVLSNLLNNAAKYTPEGGEIFLSVERGPDECIFRVRDTGTGIPRHMLGKIFDLFTQADCTIDRAQGGLGIGLTLVRALVEMHGGSVTAFSAGLDQGSEFTVRLPLGEQRSRAVDTVDAVRLTSSRRVLVVDDNADAAESLALLLRLSGHQVETVHDGPAALAAARVHRPEVVLLDLGLPGMDGYEVARRLRAETLADDIFLVALTGYGREEDRRRSHAAGFHRHLVKPVAPADLHDLLAGLHNVVTSVQ
jgi:signal transduction histidine kinase